MVINQEELKVTRLTYSTLIEDEQNTVCKHINFLIEVFSKLIVSFYMYFIVCLNLINN